jgi:cytosine/adenosine deaminase-related metal-dependent hydrolase
VVLIKNDSSPTMFPVINPYAHLVYQVGRGDVDTVLVNGAPVKFQGRLVSGDLNSVRRDVEDTVDYLSEMLGKEQWKGGMFQQMPGAD